MVVQEIPILNLRSFADYNGLAAALVGHVVNKVPIRAPLMSQGKAYSAGNGKPFPRSTT